VEGQTKPPNLRCNTARLIFRTQNGDLLGSCDHNGVPHVGVVFARASIGAIDTMSKQLLNTALLLASTYVMFASDDGPLSVRLAASRTISSDIRVNVDMALVPVFVTDAFGRSVTGLAAENFRVFEGSRQMPIATFGSQDQPIAVGLIFDCSRSMRDKFKTAREAARQFFQQLNPDDESFLITVSDRAEVRHSLTTDFEELQNALLFSRPSGSTSLLDGIHLGLAQIRKSRSARKALVIVSDGGDNNSRYSLHELQQAAVESDTQIFALGLHDNPQSVEEMHGPALLSELCGKTGGGDFVIRDLSELQVVMGKIGVSLHNQYVLGYYPPDQTRSGKYRKIKVVLMVPPNAPPLQVHARAGYYAR
jgi:Ca-activated chloride channel family protein